PPTSAHPICCQRLPRAQPDCTRKHLAVHSTRRHAHQPDLHTIPTRRSSDLLWATQGQGDDRKRASKKPGEVGHRPDGAALDRAGDRRSTRLNSSHVKISYAGFCLKKRNKEPQDISDRGQAKGSRGCTSKNTI